MNSPNIFYLVLLLFALPLYSYSQKNVWTYDDCVKYALKNNLNIKQQSYTNRVAAMDFTKNKLELLPTISLGTGLNIGLGRSIDPVTNDITNKPVLSSNLNMNISMTIFDGFKKWNTLKQTKLDNQNKKLEAQQIERDIRIQIASVYMQLLYSMEQVSNVKQERTITEKQLERSQVLAGNGRISKKDIYDLQAVVSQKELDILNIENEIVSFKIQLRQLLQLDDSQKLNMVSPKLANPDSSILLKDAASLIKQSKVITEYKINQTNIEIAKLDYKQSSRYYLPKITLNYSAGSGVFSNNIERVENDEGELTTSKVKLFDQLENNFSQSIGIGVDLPFLNSTTYLERNRGRAKIALEQAKLNSKIQNDKTYKNITTLLAEAQVAYRSYAIALKRNKILKESYHIVETKYNLGRQSFLDFITSQNNFESSSNDLLRRKYNSVLKIKILDFYMGIPLTL